MSHISTIKLPDNSTYDLKDNNAIAISEKGAANGVVPLNAASQINSAYLPSYVDDVIEGYYYNNKFWKESTHTTEIAGEAGKIYINLETNPASTYRYSGSAFVHIGGGGSVITITRDLTSGTKSATINIDGTDFDIYSTDNTTYESKAAVSGGTDVSLVTTGEKAAWNEKTSNVGTVTSVGIASASNNTISVSGSPVTSNGTITLGLKLGYTTSENNRAVQADSNGNLYVTQIDTNTWKANSSSSEGYVASGSGQVNKVWMTNANGEPAWREAAKISSLTQAQYDALSTAEKNNGTVYFITDGNPSNVWL